MESSLSHFYQDILGSLKSNSCDKHCEKGARGPSPFEWSRLPH